MPATIKQGINAASNDRHEQTENCYTLNSICINKATPIAIAKNIISTSNRGFHPDGSGLNSAAISGYMFASES